MVSSAAAEDECPGPDGDEDKGDEHSDTYNILYGRDVHTDGCVHGCQVTRMLEE